MTRRTYTPEYKAKLVIEVLQGEKELNTIAAENSISPNMLRNWKAEFLENAGRAFDGSRQTKEARRKEADLKKTQAQMDGKSRWADNVMIERWFRSLKTEEIYLNEYPNPRALRKAISVYIQQYNTVRPHQALEYKTPESVYQSCFASQATDLDSLVLAG